MGSEEEEEEQEEEVERESCGEAAGVEFSAEVGWIDPGPHLDNRQSAAARAGLLSNMNHLPGVRQEPLFPHPEQTGAS